MDLSELKKEKGINDKQRLEWIDYWVDYMKKNPNEYVPWLHLGLQHIFSKQ